MKGKPVPPIQPSAADNRQQRATLMLRDVAYVVEAHFVLAEKAGPDDTPEKHYNIALRRMREGQCFHRPYLGCREFAAHFELIEGDVPPSFYAGGDVDLGWMLHDIDFDDKMTAHFFRARMVNGRVCLPPLRGGGGP